MTTVQFSTRIDEGLKRAIDGYCRDHHIELSQFVQEALSKRLVEVTDQEILEQARCEPTRPLTEVLDELGLEFPD